MCYFGTCNQLCVFVTNFCDDFFSNFDFSENVFWPWRLFVTNFCRSMLKVCFTNYRLEIKCSFKNYFNPLDFNPLDLSINAFVSSIFDSIEVKEDFFFLDGCSSKTFCGKVDLSFVHSMYVQKCTYKSMVHTLYYIHQKSTLHAEQGTAKVFKLVIR